jgi:hypothetical protein
MPNLRHRHRLDDLVAAASRGNGAYAWATGSITLFGLIAS